MARLPKLPALHHFSFIQRAVLGDLRLGPQWATGLLKQTYWALHRRGLVASVEYRDFEHCWRLTPAGRRVVLALGLATLKWWQRRHLGLPRLPAEPPATPAARARRPAGP